MIMTNRVWAYICLLSLLFGASFFFTQILVNHYNPLQISLMRTTIGGITLYAVCHFMGLRFPKNPRFWSSVMMLGLLNITLGASLNATAQTYLSSSIASVLNGLTPIMTIFFSFLLLRDHQSNFAKLFAGLIGLVGLSIIATNGKAPEDWGSLTGYAFCIASTICYALASIYGKTQVIYGYDYKIMAAGQLISANIFLIPMAAVSGDLFAFATPNNLEIMAIIGMAILSSAIAYAIYFYILTLTSATNLVFVTLMVPVSAISLGTIILHETMSDLQILGTMIIGLSLIVADGRIFLIIGRKRHP